jgi:hypothetical protein
VTTTDPFPEIHNRVELDAVPAREWVECVSCVEHHSLTDGTDATVWGETHMVTLPHHNRFRVVRQSNFRIVPSGVAPSGFVGVPTE